MGHRDHKEKAGDFNPRVFVITVSDTRTEETDTSGALIKSALAGKGFELSGYSVLKDEPAQITELVFSIAASGKADAVIINGGTGISRRDSTFEAVDSALDKRLDGFGELFRMLSYSEIGSAAMMSRATAGICRGIAVFSVPGSEGAVRLALEKLIMPELKHILWETGR